MLLNPSPYQLGVCYRGIGGIHCAAELNVLNMILGYVQPKKILEFGTYYGLVTLLFSDWAYENGAQVLSLDNTDYVDQRNKKKFDSLPVEFLLGSEYDQLKVIPRLIDFVETDETLFIYCDGGNKPQEFFQWSRFLKPRDCIACHDYVRSKEQLKALRATEFEHVGESLAARTMKRYGLEPLVPLDAHLSGMHVFAAIKPKENNDGSSVSSCSSAESAGDDQ